MKFQGTVIAGNQIARQFGIATANLDCADALDLLEGVYFVQVTLQDTPEIPLYGLLHYGQRKTFGESFSAEVHLFDFDQILYSKRMEVEVLQKLRDVMKFQNADALFSQVERDIIQGKKIVIRRQMMNQWKGLTMTEKAHYKGELIKLLKSIPEILEAGSLLLYAPDVRYEIEGILELMEIFPDKNYAFPRIEDQSLVFHWIKTREDLTPSDFGILAPKVSAPRVSLESLSSGVCLVPSLALDGAGYRLGRGKGFYDRFLEGKSFKTIALVPDFAFVPEIPHEVHDQKISKVIAVSGSSC